MQVGLTKGLIAATLAGWLLAGTAIAAPEAKPVTPVDSARVDETMTR